MKYLLDSNAVIDLAKGQGRSHVFERVRLTGSTEIALSVIVMHELLFGAFRSAPERQAENLRRLDALPFAILPLELEDVRAAAHVREKLAAQGRPIGPLDVLIAGQALNRRLTVITNNVREFRRVDGLKVEDWTLPP